VSGRIDGRTNDQLRALRIEPEVNRYAEGSALVTMGHTRVLCMVSVEDRVPDWMRGSGEGWLTAEYAMLPRATHTRARREVSRGRPSGRTLEIQRLLGRAFRASVDRKLLGERTLMIDCDVLQADGGTRCASVNGGAVALALACRKLVDSGRIESWPLRFLVNAISVGRVDGDDRVDLDYEEDSSADLDLNILRTEDGRLLEIQGGAEGEPFAQADLTRLLELSGDPAERITERQRASLKGLIEP